MLFTKLFPRVVVIVPFFVTLRNLQMMNTYQGLILVYLMVTFPVAIWLLKGFFDKIPVEIEEAAIVDGCSLPQLLWLIVIPMSRPALVAVAMYPSFSPGTSSCSRSSSPMGSSDGRSRSRSPSSSTRTASAGAS